MLELGAGRRAAIRDLDAVVARLHELAPEDWERDTPDAGWKVRHLAAHLTTTIPFVTTVLGQVIAIRLGHLPTMETGIEVTPDSDRHDITASVTQHRNAFVHTISAMAEDDLT
ncbi:MAG TPA: maleylpyruvate isomerase N-terminal domain-containing protein, partial [Thermomicrobiales bacterium]|nr:maleylpyruvate isomerase N-terminal domain-containing protein [Thermomicrobiales bacterium]